MTNDENIYGVDLDKPVTPFMARDALVECFFQAHCADSGLGTDDPAVNREYIQKLVKKAFGDAGGDFEKPTKQSILNVMAKLKDFAAHFRDQSIIQKHAGEMMKIVEKI
jgi:hypothetical protein